MTIENARHSFTKKNREAMYAFFQQHLDNPGDASDYDIESIPVEELWITETGQLATSLKGETIYSLNKKVVEAQVLALESSRANMKEHLAKIPDAAIKFSGFSYPKKIGAEIFSGRYVNETYKLEKYLLPGSGDYMLPLALFIPNKTNKKEAIILLHEKGKKYAINSDGLAKQLLAEGYAVLLGDLPGIGELGPGYLKGDAYINNTSYNLWFAGILTGKSIVGLRAEDIIRMVHFVKTNLSDYNSISAISVGQLGSELLHAAALEKEIQKVCLIHPFLSYAEIAMEYEYKTSFIHSTVAGAIEEYDLADLMAVICPRKILVIDPLSADGKIADEVKAKNSILFPHKEYTEKSVPGNLELIVGTKDQLVLEYLRSWLK